MSAKMCLIAGMSTPAETQSFPLQSISVGRIHAVGRSKRCNGIGLRRNIVGMKKFKHLRFASRRYVMSLEESAIWERADDHERRKLIDMMGDRLAEEVGGDGGVYSVSFYRADGTLIAKSTLHEPLFPERSTS